MTDAHASDFLLYPYALDGNNEVADAKTAPREQPYHCIGCSQPMILKRGQIQRPHFAHRSKSSTCAPETVLHRMAKEAIRAGIEDALQHDRPYLMKWRCSNCGSINAGDLARTRPRHVVMEKPLEGARPDLLIVGAGGKPLTVIEIVVTHKPEQSTLRVYTELGLPVIMVKPDWDAIDGLRQRLTQVEVSVIGGPCRWNCPPTEPAELCTQCSRPMKMHAIEIWRGDPCPRCGKQMVFMDIPKQSDRVARQLIRYDSLWHAAWSLCKQKSAHARASHPRRLLLALCELRCLGMARDTLA